MGFSLFGKCFCCIPLRNGLLAWGYLKLFLLFGAALFIAQEIYSVIQVSQFLDSPIMMGIIMLATIRVSVIIIFVVTELIFNLLLICGIHKRNYKLLTAYVVYNIMVLLVISSCTSYTIYTWISQLPLSSSDSYNYFNTFTIQISIAIAYLYLVLLVQSEVSSLKKKHCFKDDKTISKI